MKLTHLLRCSGRFFARYYVSILLTGIVYGAPLTSLAQQLYSVKIEKGPLEAAIAEVRKVTGAVIAYNNKEVATLQVQAATFNNLGIEALLKKIIAGQPLNLQKEGNTWVLLKGIPASPQPGKPVKGPGKITGKVIDEENGQPVAGATILIAGKGVSTDVEGIFNISLPKGSYTATISCTGYGAKEITEIEVTDDQRFELPVTLKRQKGQLAGVVVRASARKEGIAALYVRQKNAAGITDGISAEQISRTPDKNIGESLKRISGLSSLDNKYVVVRGLSERYNQSMMNGQMMPSTEMNRKNFSFDIIPSNLVDNVIVTKTLTPDQSAEFGGGMVQVNTKDIPAENTFSVNIGSSSNDKTTGKAFVSPEIEQKEYFAAMPDNRKLFGITDWKSRKDIVSSPHFLPGVQDNSDLKDVSLFTNNWGLHHYTPIPGVNAQVSLGRVIPLHKEQQLGIIASVSYRTTWQTQDVRLSRGGYYPGDILKEKAGFTGKRYGFTSNVAGIAGVGYKNKAHKVSLQTLYLRMLDQQFVLGKGVHDVNGKSAGYYDLFSTTSLWQNQLKTEHLLGHKGIKLNLSVSYTNLDRQKPDNHQAILSLVDQGEDDPANPHEDFSITSASSSGIDAGVLRSWSRTHEKNLGWNADLLVPFAFKALHVPLTNVFKLGYAGWNKDRLFWTLLTGSKGFTNGEPKPLSETFVPEAGGTIYSSRFGDDFHRSAKLHAGYMMMDNKIGKKLRLVWGIRGEYYNLNKVNAILDEFVVKQKLANGGDVTDYSELFNREPNMNFFPSANITYSLTSKMNLRMAWSKSIIRPDLRETAWFQEYDFELGGSYWSQSPLVSTKISHYDFRYEWYPSAGEILSFSLFYKKMLNPMEIFAKENRLFELQNDKDAINKGIEVEARKSFAFTGIPVLKKLTLSGNLTRLFSKVRTMQLTYSMINPERPKKLYVIEHVGEEEDRPQSGASNFMYNLGAYYDDGPLSVSVSYNHIANRFYRVGNLEVGSLYEQPLNPLDAQVSWKVLKNKGMVKLNVGNLLNGKYILYTNLYPGNRLVPEDGHKPSLNELLYQKGTDVIDYEAAPGRTYSVSFSYNF